MRSNDVSVVLVKTSGSGLPLASVSNGTAAGMLVPRRRTYCEAETAGIRNAILKNVVLSSSDVIAIHGELPLPLKVRRIEVDTFLAASGTTERSATVPSAANHAVLRGHSPA